MPASGFQRRLLERALHIAGSTQALCLRLGVHEHSLYLWSEDRAPMPGRIFLAVADLILEDDIARARQDRRIQPRPFDATEPAAAAQAMPKSSR